MRIQILLLFSVLLFIHFGCSKEEFIPSVDDHPLGKINCSGEEKQEVWTDFQLITPCESGSISYFIDPDCEDSGYTDAMLAAIIELGASNTSLFFVPAASAASADLFFNCANGSTCGWARASAPFSHPGVPNVQTTFPSGGTIGGEMIFRINWSTCECDGTSAPDPNCEPVEFDLNCFLKRTALHEVGHALGVAHNGQGTAPGNAITVPGTPDVSYDPNSIFNNLFEMTENCEWCDAPCQLNTNDLITLQYLYPLDCSCFYCVIPGSPPIDFDNFCIGETVCYNFAGYPCMANSTITSSSPKVIVEQQGTQVCLTSIFAKPESVTISIEAPFSRVGNLKGCASPVTNWTINVNDPDHCSDGPVVGGGDPPTTGGGPSAEDCLDFENPCPCETKADCPEGWKCVGPVGNKFCIEG